MKDNFLLMCDSYKAGHASLYPDDLTHMYAYLANRKGFSPSIFFGLQYVLKEYFVGPVFTAEDIEEARAFWTAHFGRDDYFNADVWYKLLDKHNGCLPIRIRALPEGSRLNRTGAPYLSVENTDPEFPWIVTFVEALLIHLWYPMMTASIAATAYKSLKRLFDTCTLIPPDYYIHDFGFRAATCPQQGAIGGMGHLLFFKGSDNVPAVRYLQKYYSADMPASSIPATEHSIVLSYQMKDERVIQKLLKTFPTGYVASVSDTTDYVGMLRKLISNKFIKEIKEREGIFVIRPDSGNAVETITHTLRELERYFGATTNSKGYKVINDHVRVIWGSSVKRGKNNDYSDIYYAVLNNGYSVENVVLGVGNGLIQDNMTRDSLETIYKVSQITLADGSVHDVKKNSSYKESYSGRVTSTATGGLTYVGSINDAFELVFEDGKLIRDSSFEEVQINASIQPDQYERAIQPPQAAWPQDHWVNNIENLGAPNDIARWNRAMNVAEVREMQVGDDPEELPFDEQGVVDYFAGRPREDAVPMEEAGRAAGIAVGVDRARAAIHNDALRVGHVIGQPQRIHQRVINTDVVRRGNR